MAGRLQRESPVADRHPEVWQQDPDGQAVRVRQLRLDAGDEHADQQGHRRPARNEAGEAGNGNTTTHG